MQHLLYTYYCNDSQSNPNQVRKTYYEFKYLVVLLSLCLVEPTNWKGNGKRAAAGHSNLPEKIIRSSDTQKL